MFDVSRLRKGMDHLYQEISYENVGKVNDFYKRVLAKSPAPIPAFFEEIDRKAVLERAKAGDTAALNTQERDFLLIKDMRQNGHRLGRAELLSRMRSISRRHAKDARLSLTCARIMMQYEHYGDATLFLQRAIELAPKSKYAWSHLALISAFAHDHGTTLTAARRSLELKEDMSSMMLKAYVFTLMLQGVPAKAGPFDSRPLFHKKPFAEIDFQQPRPEVVFHREPEELQDASVVMFACDDTYFKRFARTQLLSLMQADGKIGIHVHIINPSEASLSWLDSFADRYFDQLIVSHENIPDKLLKNISYLASCRFINMPDFIRRFERPYLAVDADALLNSPDHLTSFFAQVKEPTVFYSEFSPVWDTISAPFTYVPNTEDGLAFIDTVQHFLIRSFFEKGGTSFWYIDQMALQGATLAHADKVQLATNRQVSCRLLSEDAIFWTLSTNKQVSKFQERCADMEKRYPMD